MKTLAVALVSLRSLPLVAALSMVLVGCVVASSGTKIEQSKIDQIKKGVTTRAQIEEWFGTPSSTTTMGDGSRTLFYQYSETKLKNIWVIPIPGPITPSGSTGEHRQRTLQITLSNNDIVQDFVSSESGSTMTQGPFGNSKTTAISPDKK